MLTSEDTDLLRALSGYVAVAIDNSLLCAGSIVSGGTIERSILGPETYVDASAVVSESILFPGVYVGPGAQLYRCVVDKNVEIPAGRSLGHDIEADREEFTISDRGVVVVEKDRQLS